MPEAERVKGMRTRFSLIMLVFGVVLLWLVPLGGALMIVAASMGLAIAFESDMASQGDLAVEYVDSDRRAVS